MKIIVGAVKGTIAAGAEVCAGRGDQRLGVRQDEPLGNRCGSARQFARQVFALIGVEHRKSFEERDRVGLVSVALRALAFLIGHKTVAVDDRRAMLALADIAAEAERLAEGEPILGAEAALDHRAPRG
jgi:hypothetical protein